MNASVEQGLLAPALRLDAAQVRAARETARRDQRRVSDVLEETLSLTPDGLMRALGQALHYPVLGIQALDALEPAFDRLPYTESLTRGCLVLREGPHGGEDLLVVIADPFDDALLAWCDERLTGVRRWALAHAGDIAAYLARHEESMRAIDSAVPAHAADAAAGSAIDDLSIRSISEGTSAVVKLVHSTLYDALKSGVSDIHVESHLSGLAIKYRLDGTLTQVSAIEGRELAEQVLSRLKVMSELDIAERRIPQDGRFRVKAFGREIDFRVSIMPSIHGEDAVLRILDKRALADQLTGLRLDVLGFDEPVLAAFRRLSRDPYGLLLVTGPTGSGKTTTLYAALSEINHGHDKIITIEDPVEYQLSGVLQIPVNEKKGLTFARGLRSILRHDPDRIMVGEIRDPETAQIAIQAALTGHLVLSTVHANNVFDVIGRFTHMDVDPYSFVSALSGVLAQRLLRINCTHCSGPVDVDAAALEAARIDPAATQGRTLKAGKGCGKCRGTGYRGRKAVGELLLLDDKLRELIVARAPVRQIKQAARENGTRFLRDAAVDLFLQGQTTLEEVNRVTLVS
ncbi:GspE/PulE family protein [Methylibium sp.]|uniref:GspE/PulE family protein n=1 Tax=Methylibium sp. TaxID=2067992 RepID=UPI003D0ED956